MEGRKISRRRGLKKIKEARMEKSRAKAEWSRKSLQREERLRKITIQKVFRSRAWPKTSAQRTSRPVSDIGKKGSNAQTSKI